MWVAPTTIDPEMSAQEHATHGGAVDRALLGREVCELTLGAADVSAVRHFSFLLSSANLLIEHNTHFHRNIYITNLKVLSIKIMKRTVESVAC
jgi:hypothetical protein